MRGSHSIFVARDQLQKGWGASAVPAGSGGSPVGL